MEKSRETIFAFSVFLIALLFLTVDGQKIDRLERESHRLRMQELLVDMSFLIDMESLHGYDRFELFSQEAKTKEDWEFLCDHAGDYCHKDSIECPERAEKLRKMAEENITLLE